MKALKIRSTFYEKGRGMAKTPGNKILNILLDEEMTESQKKECMRGYMSCIK